MDGIKSLLSSEHGLFGILLIVAATVLCAVGIMTIGDWKGFAEFVFATFAGAHAVVTSTNQIANARAGAALSTAKKEG